MHLEDKFGGVSGRWSQYSSAVREVEIRRGSTAIGVARGRLHHLGHSKVSMTQDVYMTRGKVHSEVADLLGDAISGA